MAIKLLHFSGLILLAILTGGCQSSGLQPTANQLNALQNQVLNEKTVIAGLKKALHVGIHNSVKSTFTHGGYSDNPLIKIAIPYVFETVAENVRKLGFGHYVEQFEQQLNRAAEQASGESLAVFIDAIAQLSVADGWKLLKGGPHAATDYFRTATEQQLRHKFAPIIAANMEKVGCYAGYRRLLSTYQSIPFVTKPDLDIEKYVMNKSLDGLFLMIAQEEQKIRRHPAARTTDLLKRVFAGQPLTHHGG